MLVDVTRAERTSVTDGEFLADALMPVGYTEHGGVHMRRLSSSALRILAVAACLAYGTARAEPLAYDERNAPQPPLDWYGWQILLVDLASTAAIVGGSVAAQDGGTAIAIPIVGGAGYLAGGPLVHLAHGEGDRATRSALLRAFVPLGVGALGAGLGALSAGSGSNEICASKRACGAAFGALLGVSAGMLTAMVADWVTAASARPFSSPPQPSSLVPEARTWTPLVLVGPRTTVMLAVRF